VAGQEGATDAKESMRAHEVHGDDEGIDDAVESLEGALLGAWRCPHMEEGADQSDRGN
jgi:hypothetical protein